jgi:hypothetical protein
VAIEKAILGVAGEFAVASELCRRGLYAQLTLGHRKRTDLLVETETGHMCRIEVKAKQGRDWPNCLGIAAEDSFLVFVDFAGKAETERPDFYVLISKEWRALAMLEMERYKAKHPDRRAEITNDNIVVLPDEVNRYGKPYKGVGVRPENVREHRDAWHKIASVVEKCVAIQ